MRARDQRLVPVELDALPELTPRLAQVAADGEKTSEDFFEAHIRTPVPGFVPCDFVASGRALTAVWAQHLAPGPAFCEWGSGVGAVTVIASLLGFDAVGIEIDADLVATSRELAQRAASRARFIHGSFIPEGHDDIADETGGDMAWLITGAEAGYTELGLEIDDFDVIFAYPWPGEESVLENLFIDHAAAGALLITYNGVEGVRVARKKPARRDAHHKPGRTTRRR